MGRRRWGVLCALGTLTGCGGPPAGAPTATATPAPKCAKVSTPGRWSSMTGEHEPTWPPERATLALWTGTHALFATGFGGPTAAAFYDPCQGRWERVATDGAPAISASVAWIGGRLFSWNVAAVPQASVYDRAHRHWQPHSLPVSARRAPRVGSRVVLFAEDERRTTKYANGAIMNVQTQRQTPLVAADAPSPRVLAAVTSLPDAHALFVFGGRDRADATPMGDGAVLNVDTGTWIPLPAHDAPSPRYAATALRHGNEVIVWGGRDGRTLADGARYLAGERRWVPMSTEHAPLWNDGVAAVTHGFFVTVSGRSGARYDLGSDRWFRFDVPTKMSAPWVTATTLFDGTVLYSHRDGDWFWRLDPSNGQWSNIPLGDRPRHDATILVGGQHLFLWGGWTSQMPREPSCNEALTICTPAPPGKKRHSDGVLWRL